MTPRCVRAAAAAVLVVAGASAALAQGVVDTPSDKEAWPVEITRRPLTLARGMVEITVAGNIQLSDGSVAR